MKVEGQYGGKKAESRRAVGDSMKRKCKRETAKVQLQDEVLEGQPCP